MPCFQILGNIYQLLCSLLLDLSNINDFTRFTELLTLLDDHVAKNLHVISWMNADFKILTNFHICQ